MPYIKAQTPNGAKYYWVEELSYLPEGAQFHTVPIQPQTSTAPPPPPGPSEFELRLKKWKQAQIDARVNTLRNQAWATEAQRRARATPAPKPHPKPTVYVPSVIDPKVRWIVTVPQLTLPLSYDTQHRSTSI